MRIIRGSIFRALVVIAFGLATFWPEYGLAFLLFHNFQSGTLVLPSAAFSAFWVAAFFLFLPVSLWTFQKVSVASLVVMYVVAILAASSAGMINVLSSGFWLTWGVAGLFSIIGWLLIATPIWKSFHSIVPVQDTDDHDFDHHHG